MNEREYRNFAEIRSEESAEYKVEGYASTFEPYEMCEIEGEKYFERIEPTAFEECDMSDVVLRVDHAGAVFARTSAGTLIVNTDEHGLHTEADLSRTANSRALYDEIKAGNYPQMSFCFTVPEGGDHFDKDSRTRVIERIGKLYDVSPVSFPANPGTELHARALEYFNGEIEKLKAERPEEVPEAEEVIEERIEQEEIAETPEEVIETEERSVETAEAVTDETETEDRKAEQFAEYRALQQMVSNGDVGTVVETHREEMEMEERKYTPETPEYRDAFYAVIGDYATAEQRAIVVDSTAPGDGDAIAIPKTLDTKIWDNIHTAHPILADIATVRSGVAMEVTKHTAIAVRTSKKLDSAATPAEEANTFVKVVLYGYDYEKYVTLTYAEAKMSAGALEDYLAEEISAELGEALAKDVFAQTLTDAGAGQKVTSTSDMFADVKAALALATGASAPTIYAPASAYFEIVGAIAQGSPFNIGAALGCPVKLDNAATKVTILDPKKFVLNMVQDVMIESDKDVKAHKVIVSGYLRAQGTLRNNKAAAYID